MAKDPNQEWLRGKASLGAAAGWTPEEMRLVADLGYSLAEQGRNQEALEIFEGLASLAPATAYFQLALGALKLRVGALEEAREHLSAALVADPHDVAALTNRGEVLMLLGNETAAINDLQTVLNIVGGQESSLKQSPYAVRARALLALLTNFQSQS